MNVSQRASLFHSGTVQSRRTTLGALAASTLGSFSALLDSGDADAKKKGKKKKKNKKGGQASPLRLAYECPGPPDDIEFFGGNNRVAQVFAATRSGALRRIEVLIEKDSDDSDYVIQLLRVAASGTPYDGGSAVLAAAVIPYVDVPDGASTVTGSFVGPALVAGMDYAAVIGRIVGPWVKVGTFTGTGDACPGRTFFATDFNPFQPFNSKDLVISVFVD
jgi:hypothetical protein